MSSSMQPVRCGACGAVLADGASSCSVCGAGATPAVAEPPPAPRPVAEAPREPPAGPTPPPAPAHRSSRSDGIVGVVRDLKTRSEQRSWADTKPEQVITFRIDRFDDDGRALGAVPVEMRGRKFRGFLNDGDWVEVPGRWTEGELLTPSKARNLTTGAPVEAEGTKSMTWLGCLVFAVIALVLILGFVWLASTWDAPVLTIGGL